jgi:hypothetical protein
MRVGSRWRIGCKPGQALLGWIFATFIVAVAVFGPPLTGQSSLPMVELRHDVLMIDREFERWSASGRTSGLMYDDLSHTRSVNTPSKVRAHGDIR